MGITDCHSAGLDRAIPYLGHGSGNTDEGFHSPTPETPAPQRYGSWLSRERGPAPTAVPAPQSGHGISLVVSTRQTRPAPRPARPSPAVPAAPPDPAGCGAAAACPTTPPPPPPPPPEQEKEPGNTARPRTHPTSSRRHLRVRSPRKHKTPKQRPNDPTSRTTPQQWRTRSPSGAPARNVVSEGYVRSQTTDR